MKYAIRGTLVGRLAEFTTTLHSDRPYLSWSGGNQPTLFDSQQQALGALQDYVKNGGVRDYRLEIVAVEEIPGETTREVVEMEGVVDHDSLTGYALRGTLTGELYGRPLYASIMEAMRDTRDPYVTVVGIRETTTKPTRRIVPLAPASE